MELISREAMIEFASYLRSDSAFRMAASDIFGRRTISNFNQPVRFMLATKPNPSSLKYVAHLSPIAHRKARARNRFGIKIEGKNNLKSIAKNKEAVCIVENSTIYITQARGAEEPDVLGKVLREAEGECKKKKIGAKERKIIIKILLTLAFILSGDAVSDESPSQPRDSEMYIVTTSSGNLNVRSSASFNSRENIIGKLERFDRVVVVDEINGAYKIDCSAMGSFSGYDDCFVSKKFVTRISPKNSREIL